MGQGIEAELKVRSKSPGWARNPNSLFPKFRRKKAGSLDFLRDRDNQEKARRKKERK